MVKRSKNEKATQKMQKKYHNKQNGAPSRSASSSNPDRKVNEESKGFYRSKSKIKILKMYTEKPNMEKFRAEPDKPVRIEPNRKWFGNVRTIDQKKLEKFRVEIAKQTKDPYQMLLKNKLLPISLLKDNATENRMNLLEVETYEDTFGPKSRRKRVKLETEDMVNMLDKVEKKQEEYKHEKDRNLMKQMKEAEFGSSKDWMLQAGQSKRIWEELYKVLDSSDVVVQVIDARDPMGTRCTHVEEHIKTNAPHKHLILVLNKCDLVPTWITKKWLKILSKEYPTLAYHASIQNSFGKGALIQLLRQFDNFHKDKKTLSVGFIGYPNVGKSSVINSLKSKAVCKAAPIPGETKVWQYITLTKRIYLIDCPGVVYNATGESDLDIVLKGVVRAERLEDPTLYIHGILTRTEKKDLKKLYDIDEWADDDDFLAQLAAKKGRLLKGSEPDMKTVAKMLLCDWQRGKIPYFIRPPNADDIDDEDVAEPVPSEQIPAGSDQIKTDNIPVDKVAAEKAEAEKIAKEKKAKALKKVKEKKAQAKAAKAANDKKNTDKKAEDKKIKENKAKTMEFES
jgi:nuclear GTP-binding protein